MTEVKRVTGGDIFLPPSELYMKASLAYQFADLENNDHHEQVADMVDRVIAAQIPENGSLHVAELGAGARVDRYRRLFNRLLASEGSRIDWVDEAEPMISVAQKTLEKESFRERRGVVEFFRSGIREYLEGVEDGSLDLMIMKNTFGYIQNLNGFFQLVARKLKPGGKLIATAKLNPSLSGKSPVGRFYVNNALIHTDETVRLEDGDRFTIEFFGEPNSSPKFLAKTTKCFHLASSIQRSADDNGLDCRDGDWRDFTLDHKGVELDVKREIMVLTRRS